jgi:hypothetical protein
MYIVEYTVEVDIYCKYVHSLLYRAPILVSNNRYTRPYCCT